MLYIGFKLGFTHLWKNIIRYVQKKGVEGKFEPSKQEATGVLKN